MEEYEDVESDALVVCTVRLDRRHHGGARAGNIEPETADYEPIRSGGRKKSTRESWNLQSNQRQRGKTVEDEARNRGRQPEPENRGRLPSSR